MLKVFLTLRLQGGFRVHWERGYLLPVPGSVDEGHYNRLPGSLLSYFICIISSLTVGPISRSDANICS